MSSSKTIAKNTLFLYIRMFLIMGVSLFTSRIVLEQLGVSDYGIYSLVGGIVAMFGFFNSAMSSATQRYLAFDIGKGDKVHLQKTFSLILTIHIVTAIIVLLLSETVGLWYVNNKMVFPIERYYAVNVVYQFSIFTFLIGITRVPYNALIIAREKMGVYAYVSIIEVILKLVIVYLLVYFGNDKLIIYAILTFVVALVIRVIYQIYCRMNFNESRYKFEYDKVYFKELLSYSGWNLFGSVAAITRGQGINLILNLFFGTMVNAAYGIAVLVQSAVSSFASNFQIAVNPQIIKNYAEGNHEKMQYLIFYSSKLTFFLLLLLILPIVQNLDYILNLWLTKVPEHTVIFIKLSLVYLMIDSISFSLMTAVQATGKVKWYQIVLGTMIIINMPLSYIVLRNGGSPESVFMVLIIITFLGLFTRMFFVEKLLGFNFLIFVKNVILPIIYVCLLLFAAIWLLNETYYNELNAVTFFNFLMITIFYLVLMITIILLVGLKKNEKEFILLILKNKWKDLRVN